MGRMTALSLPDVRLYETWAEAMRELGCEEVYGAGLMHRPEAERGDLTRAGCATFVADLRRRSDTSLPPEEGLVHSDYFWMTDGDEVVGFLAVRHRLNAFLLEEGGHIGYSVRPPRRREGHATRALGLALGRAAALGIEQALVTCDEHNAASRRTIELNGGVHEDTRHGNRRYWVATGPGSPSTSMSVKGLARSKTGRRADTREVR